MREKLTTRLASLERRRVPPADPLIVLGENEPDPPPPARSGPPRPSLVIRLSGYVRDPFTGELVKAAP